ncbi:hypothetical protein RhiirA4_473215 [Rhizophagus irregularis]|uniref:Uncharacterized protein n=1 Tax=Rhizophagus irregularis TaxID=588596 RepID=A0A2I1H6A5_9GLOM|nr:hypothetical protein RhiirA4_473215 [Rhizophagus irregularis]
MIKEKTPSPSNLPSNCSCRKVQGVLSTKRKQIRTIITFLNQIIKEKTPSPSNLPSNARAVRRTVQNKKNKIKKRSIENLISRDGIGKNAMAALVILREYFLDPESPNHLKLAICSRHYVSTNKSNLIGRNERTKWQENNSMQNTIGPFF